MKLNFELDLGEVEVDTNSETGRLDGLWVDGINYADATAEELFFALVGQVLWSKKLAEAEHRAMNESNSVDRMEDEYGVPV